MCGSSPPAQAPYVAPPVAAPAEAPSKPVDAPSLSQGNDDSRRAAGAGVSDTLLTGGQGLDDAARTRNKTLLGQ